MAKKHKFQPEGETQVVETTQTTQVDTSSDAAAGGDADAAHAEGAAAPADPKTVGIFLRADTKDVNERTDYKLTREKAYPKKPDEIDITIDGQPAKLAITSSGGWATEATKGYNGWLKYEHPVRGMLNGWLIFGYNVDPKSKEQFPNGLNFTTVEGRGPANPKREPSNAEGEKRRQEAAAATRKAKAPPAATTEGAAEGTTTEGAVEGATEGAA